jgi:hypothetical protein
LLTDWLVYFIVLYIIIFSGDAAKRIGLIYITFVSFLVYVAWRFFTSIYFGDGLFGSIENLKYKILQRTGIEATDGFSYGLNKFTIEMIARINNQTFNEFFIVSAVSVTIIFLLSLLPRLRYLFKEIRYALGLLIVPVVMHLGLFNNHAFIHPWSTIKFSVIGAILVFGVLPVCFFNLAKLGKTFLLILYLPIVLFSFYSTYNQKPYILGRIDANKENIRHWEGLSHKKFSNEVAFSDVHEVFPLSQPIGFTMRLIYKSSTIREMFDKISTSKCKKEITPLFITRHAVGLNEWSIRHVEEKQGLFFIYFNETSCG